MSFIDWCDEEVIWEWKTNKFFIKEDKKEERILNDRKLGNAQSGLTKVNRI